MQSSTKDVRVGDLDPIRLTPEQDARLHGHKCARCGASGPLRPGGHAYTTSEGAGRLGWPVNVCVGSCQDHRGAGA